MTEETPYKKTVSDKLRELAEQIEKNDESLFAGAFFIAPPVGEPISGFILGAPDQATYWGMLKSKLDIAITLADEQDKRNRQMGVR